MSRARNAWMCLRALCRALFYYQPELDRVPTLLDLPADPGIDVNIQPDGDLPDGGLSCGGRERGWMGTFSGRKFYPLEPHTADVELADVAHGLAMTCRYGGQARRFYSVAEHCVLVSEFVELEARAAGLPPDVVRAYAREALLHDSAEAYIGDMIRPLKHQPEMLEFRKAEAAIEVAIFERFGIRSTSESHALIKSIDNRILIDEIKHFMPDPSMYIDKSPLLRDAQPLGASFACWTPAAAEQGFMYRYRELFS